jgi:hypothetical protein
MKIIIKQGVSFDNIDRSSDMYRVCLQCGREFMTNHRSRKHCDDKCGDDKSNDKKKTERELAAEIQAELDEIRQQELQHQLSLESNIQILDDHPISSDGKKVNMVYLDSVGFDFSSYSRITELDIKESNEMHRCVHYGPYRLYRMEYGKVLIKKET